MLNKFTYASIFFHNQIFYSDESHSLSLGSEHVNHSRLTLQPLDSQHTSTRTVHTGKIVSCHSKNIVLNDTPAQEFVSDCLNIAKPEAKFCELNKKDSLQGELYCDLIIV